MAWNVTAMHCHPLFALRDGRCRTPYQDPLPAGGLRPWRAGVEPARLRRKVQIISSSFPGLRPLRVNFPLLPGSGETSCKGKCPACVGGRATSVFVLWYTLISRLRTAKPRPVAACLQDDAATGESPVSIAASMAFPMRSAAACRSRSPTWAYRRVIVGSACPSMRATVDRGTPRATAWLATVCSEIVQADVVEPGFLPRPAPEAQRVRKRFVRMPRGRGTRKGLRHVADGRGWPARPGSARPFAVRSWNPRG